LNRHNTSSNQLITFSAVTFAAVNSAPVQHSPASVASTTSGNAPRFNTLKRRATDAVLEIIITVRREAHNAALAIDSVEWTSIRAAEEAVYAAWKEFHTAVVAVKQHETSVNELSRMNAETKSATIEAKAESW
jgi:hypothetical protein